MKAIDHDLAMMNSRRPMRWVSEWAARTKARQIDTLTPSQTSALDQLLLMRVVEKCRGCGVVLDPDLVAGPNGSFRRRPRSYCSPMCAGR